MIYIHIYIHPVGDLSQSNWVAMPQLRTAPMSMRKKEEYIYMIYTAYQTRNFEFRLDIRDLRAGRSWCMFPKCGKTNDIPVVGYGLNTSDFWFAMGSMGYCVFFVSYPNKNGDGLWEDFPLPTCIAKGKRRCVPILSIFRHVFYSCFPPVAHFFTGAMKNIMNPSHDLLIGQ